MVCRSGTGHEEGGGVNHDPSEVEELLLSSAQSVVLMCTAVIVVLGLNCP